MPFDPNPFEQVSPFLVGSQYDPGYIPESDEQYMVGSFVTPEEAEAYWGMTNAQRFWQDYGQYYRKYDQSLEDDLVKKLERDKESIVDDAYTTNHQLESGLASLGFRTGLGSKSKQLYYDTVGSKLQNEHLETLSNVNSLRKDYTKDTMDTHTTLLDMGVFKVPELRELDDYGNQEYDCQEGEGWWYGEGSFSENACEWMNETLWPTISEGLGAAGSWLFGEESMIDNYVFDPLEDVADDIFDMIDDGIDWVEDQITEGWNSVVDYFSGWSDERLKKDIKLIGQSPSGVNIYEFRYRDHDVTLSAGYDDGKYQGVLAHEVPWASVQDPQTGYYKTDYSQIDVDFKEVD